MAGKYWYRIRLSQPAKPEKIEDLKGELVRLFETTDAPRGDGTMFEVFTPLEPEKAAVALGRFGIRHGGASFVAGNKTG